VANERLRSTLASPASRTRPWPRRGVDPKTVERWVQVSGCPSTIAEQRPRCSRARAFLCHRSWTIRGGRGPGRRGAARLSVARDSAAERGGRSSRTPGRSSTSWSTQGLPGRQRHNHDRVAAGQGRAGVRIRIALGDPDCAASASEATKKRLGEGIAAASGSPRSTWPICWSRLGSRSGCTRHALQLDLSRGLDMLVNMHVYGSAARTTQ